VVYVVAEPAGFEGFMRELAEPAASLTLPPPASAPPHECRTAAR
jgi:hypothetical protein